MDVSWCHASLFEQTSFESTPVSKFGFFSNLMTQTMIIVFGSFAAQLGYFIFNNETLTFFLQDKKKREIHILVRTGIIWF